MVTKTENDPGNDEDEGSAVLITAEAYKPVPSVQWLREDDINGTNIERWWADRGALKVRDLDSFIVAGSFIRNVRQLNFRLKKKGPL